MLEYDAWNNYEIEIEWKWIWCMNDWMMLEN